MNAESGSHDHKPPGRVRGWLSRHGCWFFPVAAMVLLAPFTPAIDLGVSRLFYHPPPSLQPFSNRFFYTFLYDYGMLPGFLLLGFACIAFVLSFFREAWDRWRQPAAVLILTLVIGAGGIVNAVLKDHWGRPRPRQVIEFGGPYEFHPFYKPFFQKSDTEERRRSFPCGHCSMGFYFFAVCLLGLRYRRKGVLVAGIVLTVLLAGGLSISRIAQGGHFVSDVLMSALIMWLTALAVDWYVHNKAPEWL